MEKQYKSLKIDADLHAMLKKASEVQGIGINDIVESQLNGYLDDNIYCGFEILDIINLISEKHGEVYDIKLKSKDYISLINLLKRTILNQRIDSLIELNSIMDAIKKMEGIYNGKSGNKIEENIKNKQEEIPNIENVEKFEFYIKKKDINDDIVDVYFVYDINGDNIYFSELKIRKYDSELLSITDKFNKTESKLQEVVSANIINYNNFVKNFIMVDDDSKYFSIKEMQLLIDYKTKEEKKYIQTQWEMQENAVFQKIADDIKAKAVYSDAVVKSLLYNIYWDKNSDFALKAELEKYYDYHVGVTGKSLIDLIQNEYLIVKEVVIEQNQLTYAVLTNGDIDFHVDYEFLSKWFDVLFYMSDKIIYDKKLEDNNKFDFELGTHFDIKTWFKPKDEYNVKGELCLVLTRNYYSGIFTIKNILNYFKPVRKDDVIDADAFFDNKELKNKIKEVITEGFKGEKKIASIDEYYDSFYIDKVKYIIYMKDFENMLGDFESVMNKEELRAMYEIKKEDFIKKGDDSEYAKYFKIVKVEYHNKK